MEKTSTKSHWRDYWNRSDHQPVVTHEELLANLLATTSVKGKKILEVGAGMGGDSIYLSKKGAHVTVVDFTKEALEKINENAKKAKVTIKTVQADARNMPFADNTFDIIFHQGLLEHFKNPKELLIEQKRVLKSGGYLLVDVPQRYTTYTVKKHLLMILGKWFAGWEREFSAGELEQLLTDEGYSVVRSYGWGYYGKLHNIRFAKLGAWYEAIWKFIESTRMKLYLNWCIGVIVQKIA
ncbi:hypothetical protein A3A79_04745 [Candidatus Gottesmanbacteria bacterium RIFCSPLOWO2_01_FULL_43_11b]|uniref:Methyltransferase type 11 domain-containing protein n=1 Tax=Candidatus Gottesmanbacteria bacterium RIFCSPLOWO2_01_FULL_43_11b TaxID=1798392 RepID=A0A1F6AJ52_9BACT|nr:MAG: hypothetical protein A3A79_04745 [Candidatus Gottesmanbacteria bacterium RIFCSPLOWO2_01_FULL_43_11b]